MFDGYQFVASGPDAWCVLTIVSGEMKEADKLI